MAILIPSKNIYSVQNKKILNNKINGIEINSNNIYPDKNEKEIENKEKSIPKGNGVKFEKKDDGTVTISKGDLIQFLVHYTDEKESGTTHFSYYDSFWQLWRFKITSDLGFAEINNKRTLYENAKLLYNRISLNILQYTEGLDGNRDNLEDYPKTEYKLYNYDGKSIQNSLVYYDNEFTENNIETLITGNSNAAKKAFYCAFIHFKELSTNLISFDVLYNLGNAHWVSYVSSGAGTQKGDIYAVTSNTPTIIINGLELNQKEQIYIAGDAKHSYSIYTNELLQTNNRFSIEDCFEGYFTGNKESNIFHEFVLTKGEVKINDSIVYLNEKSEYIMGYCSYKKEDYYYFQLALVTYPFYANEVLNFSVSRLFNEYFSDKIITSYKNGKETATLRCDIGEYYNYESYTKNENGTITVTKGEKVISTKKEGNMFFKIGDEVIPMVRAGEGTDKFMSVYKDGSPKVFIVIGTKIYFDGAIYQELTLQEKTA